MNVFVCYDRCSTCKKAEAWLLAQGIPFEKRPIKEEHPSVDELRLWWQRSGLPLRCFFNTSGLKYKELQLKDKLPTMSEEDMLSLLSSDGMLVKRPLLVNEQVVLPGFREADWAAALKG
ncbi:MAG: arsenate reductase family protein [Oscillospiraceae bacterium]|nr:arsenate reductase family protein [Oscillospiraceae bacterium]